MTVTKATVLKALEAVSVPGTDTNLAAAHMIKGLAIDGGRVVLTLEVDPQHGPALEDMRQAAEKTVAALEGVNDVTAVLTAQKTQQAKQPGRSTSDPHGMNKNPRLDLPVKHIVAVASGKGGVGKSTIAFNLAVALRQQGATVGLLDADIYGPSIPRLAGLPANKKPGQDENKNLIPHEAHGLKLMSMGFMVEEERAMIWRGPMVQTAVYQMLRDVNWATADDPLDFLIVDMPPGTGDAQLTMAQKVPLAGAVIVSTPQDIALADARKGVAMFNKVDVPVLGLIENMSYHVCDNCGHEDPIFGHGGAREEAGKLGVPFLGEIPLTASIRKAGDEGVALVSDQFQDQGVAAAYRSLASALSGTLMG